jgi:hypothetical protein
MDVGDTAVIEWSSVKIVRSKKFLQLLLERQNKRRRYSSCLQTVSSCFISVTTAGEPAIASSRNGFVGLGGEDG